MFETKKLYQYLQLFASTCVALTLPLIIYKVLKAVGLKKRYQNLAAKVVVITGASSGLGEALAHEFYKQGCEVVLCARRRQELDRVRNDLLQLKCQIPTIPPVVVPLDLSDLEAIPKYAEKILSITKRVDILVNNGGVAHRGRIVSTQTDVDVKIMTVNYFGTVALTKALLPSMMSRKSGQIVFISSVQGLIALPDRSAYSASKHALQAFGDSLRAEVSEFDIAVSMISPGYIKTMISVNALTETGKTHGEMDEATETGYTADFAAAEITKAIVFKNNELVLCPFVPRAAIFLRRFFPYLYFIIMAKRAKQSQLAK